MRLTILGSGTGVPCLSRNSPGYLLVTPSRRVLVDCGSGTLLQLERAGVGCRELDAVFITHTHADHIGDLAPLIHALRFADWQRRRPLLLVGPPGFARFCRDFILPIAGHPTQFDLIITERDEERWEWEDLEIATVRTRHSERMASLAYRFQSGGRSLLLSGDGEWDPGLVGLAHRVDWAVLDCSSLEAHRMKGHLSAALCGQLALQAEVEGVILSHLYPGPDPLLARVEECRESGFSGPVRLAEDLWRLEL